ncbi:hypothetical protein ACMD2_13933 [Ananas comosus]|uniref:Uncharacterized protein n=1 Tax=Ananas comosus TaxID=4615 RepID=A0A199W7V4_ANACO|nr:hypothetical protein ACMD2_13933 [Ananas comosus]
MPPRAYVLIFFCWALITIITPTLIFWSASAKPNLGSHGEAMNEIKSRRMMSSMENPHYLEIKNRIIVNTTAFSPAPAPAPSPLPMRGIDTLR